MFKYIKSQTLNLVAVGVAGGVFLAAYFLHLNRHSHAEWRLLLGLAIAITFIAGLFHYWRLLKMTEAPISTIAAAAQGYVELYGKASCDKPLKTPFQNIPCVWYRAWVFANPQDPDNNTINIGNNRLLDYAESQTIFTLEDSTAKCEVDPKGAEIVHFTARTWRKNDHRYTEEYLPANKPLYVIGQLDTRKEILTEAKINEYLRVKMADWKSRPHELLNRFDQNRDGKIDMQEWEQARQEARRSVLAEHAMKAHNVEQNGSHFTLARPKTNQLYLISAKSPQQLRDSHQNWLIVYLSMLVLFLALYFKLAA